MNLFIYHIYSFECIQCQITTVYEKYTLLFDFLGIVLTILIIIIAIWGERFRQFWNKPKIKISLDEPRFNTTNSGIKGWYYLIRISNVKKSSPANNVRLLLTRVQKKGPDGNWREKNFSGPTQVMWQWPEISPLYATVGPDERATFGFILEDTTEFKLQLYWFPNNLDKVIPPNEPTRLIFKAVSDTAESNILIIEIAWDGKWLEGILEIQEHCILKEVTA